MVKISWNSPNKNKPGPPETRYPAEWFKNQNWELSYPMPEEKPNNCYKQIYIKLKNTIDNFPLSLYNHMMKFCHI